MSIAEPVTASRRPVLRLVPESLGADPDVDAGDALADAEALALESHCLRRRAEREASTLDRGGPADRGRVVEIVRAFKAYRPFVFDRDRALNDAAHRRLVAAYRAVRDGRPDAVTA